MRIRTQFLRKSIKKIIQRLRSFSNDQMKRLHEDIKENEDFNMEDGTMSCWRIAIDACTGKLQAHKYPIKVVRLMYLSQSGVWLRKCSQGSCCILN